jgi:hypothetical protein
LTSPLPVGTGRAVDTSLQPDADRPPGAPLSRERYELGLTFADFVASAHANVELWRAVYGRAQVNDAAISRMDAVHGHWHLLVLAEDWCGDAVNTLPVMARLAERAAHLDLRVLARDANLDIMDAHLTNHARSIPVVIVLDDHFQERGWWGPRPRALQNWVVTEGRLLEKEPRYREVRRWYARDHGSSTVDEIIAIIEGAASTAVE